jgi:hypothetical protein
VAEALKLRAGVWLKPHRCAITPFSTATDWFVFGSNGNGTTDNDFDDFMGGRPCAKPFSVPSSELDYRASCSDTAAFWRDAGARSSSDLHLIWLLPASTLRFRQSKRVP